MEKLIALVGTSHFASGWLKWCLARRKYNSIYCQGLGEALKQLDAISSTNGYLPLLAVEPELLTDISNNLLAKMERSAPDVPVVTWEGFSTLRKIEDWWLESNTCHIQKAADICDEIFRIRCINNIWSAETTLLDLGISVSHLQACLNLFSSMDQIAELARGMNRTQVHRCAEKALTLLEDMRSKETWVIPDDKKRSLLYLLSCIKKEVLDFDEAYAEPTTSESGA